MADDDKNKDDDKGGTGGTEPPKDDGKKPEADSGSDGGSGSSDSSQTPDIAKLVAEEVRKALGANRTEATLMPRRADIEKEAERMVREAAEKLKAEEQHAKDHESLADKAKEAVEDAPRKVRKLTRALWGDPDEPKK